MLDSKRTVPFEQFELILWSQCEHLYFHKSQRYSNKCHCSDNVPADMILYADYVNRFKCEMEPNVFSWRPSLCVKRKQMCLVGDQVYVWNGLQREGEEQTLTT
jgi:hypothetical protein